MVRVPRLLIAVVAVTALAGCGSSGGGSKDAATPGPTGSSTPTTGGGGTTTPGTMTLSGTFSASVDAALCTGGIASIEVKVGSDTYRGSISATSFGFVGPDAADYSLKEGEAKPTVSADGTTFSVTNVTLIDLVSKKTVVADGSIVCP